MKLKLKINMLLCGLVMALGIGFTGCSNDEPSEEEIYEVSSTKYMFRYESRITTLQELIKKNGSYDSNNGEYYSKTYLTNFGDTVKIMPKISIIVENEDEIDQIIKQFGDKLSFKNKIGSRLLI